MRSLFPKPLQDAHTHGYSLGRELSLMTPSGLRWFELSVSHTADMQARFIAVLRDITQRKASEEEVNKLAFYDP